jgi:hypothetical protein
LPLAVLAVGLVLACALPSAAAALPARFWGVVPQTVPNLHQMRRLHAGGVRSLRFPISWGAVQPSRHGPLDWSSVDAYVEPASRANVELLPFVSGTPPWAVRWGRVPGTHGHALAPKHLPTHGRAAAAWRWFLRAVVERYGPRGTFWAENPSVPRRPIRTWQIWNEANFKYFVVRPNPAEFGRLVKISHAAIRRSDPRAQIVLGGLFARPKEATYRRRPRLAYFASDFLDRMYHSTPGIRRSFDGVALHPYVATYRKLAPEIEEIRRTLRRHRDARKELWLTELGWSSEQPSRHDSFARGWRGQARQLRGAFRLLRRNQGRWRLRRVYWFSVDDVRGACNFCGGSGLFTSRFRPKPAWRAFVSFARGRR